MQMYFHYLNVYDSEFPKKIALDIFDYNKFNVKTKKSNKFNRREEITTISRWQYGEPNR